MNLHGEFLRLGEGRQRAVKHVVKEFLTQLLLYIVSRLLNITVLVKFETPVRVFCGMPLDGGVGRSEKRRSIESCKSGD